MRRVRGRDDRPTQRRFAFMERRERLERRFKWAIAVGTAAVLATAMVGTAVGRYLLGRGAFEAKAATERWIGLPTDRADVEADWRRQRERDVAKSREVLRKVYARVSPEIRRLLDFGGLDPDRAVLRWGNYNRIMLLPSRVLVPDDHGRSYRMRPNTRSVWLRDFDLPDDLAGFFLLPDEPELRPLVAKTGGYLVPGSEQTTNSWGCRGPEPDVNAPLRGLILGDSNMQGLFVGDDQTPPEYLRRELQAQLGVRVSLLNTGHLGYSPEQMYYTLREYGDRFRPHFVIFTFCPNDFGTLFDPVPDRRDVEEARHWIDQIDRYCRKRNWLRIDTAIPHEFQIVSTRRQGAYPGRACDLLSPSGLTYCNPVEAFVDEHLRQEVEHMRRGEGRPPSSPLFNGAIHDAHMSAPGAALWGQELGHRVALLLERERLGGTLKY